MQRFHQPNLVSLLLQLQKKLDGLPTVLLCRNVQRRVALLVGQETRTVGEKLTDPVNPSQLTGNVERRRPVLIRRVDVRTVVAQILDQLRRLRRDGDDQRLVAQLLPQTHSCPTTPMLLLMSKPPIT